MMNAVTISIITNAVYDILDNKKEDFAYVQTILNLLENSFDQAEADKPTLKRLHRRLFRHFLRVSRAVKSVDLLADRPGMRVENRISLFLQQEMLRESDPNRIVENSITLTTDEMAELQRLRQYAKRRAEFEERTPNYDFIENASFRFKPIAALSNYMLTS